MGSFKLAVLGLASFVFAPASQAAEIYYNFVDAGYSGNGNSANLSGGFVWDTELEAITQSNISLVGAKGESAVSCTNCTTGIYDEEHFAINLGPDALYLAFASPLSTPGNHALSLFAPTEGNRAEFHGGYSFTDVTGAAVAAVPEASTWAMMVLGFGVVGYSLRSATRRARVTFAA